jgi:hypothetical protein
MTGAWSLVALITARYAVLWSAQLSKVSSGLYIGPDPVAGLCNDLVLIHSNLSIFPCHIWEGKFWEGGVVSKNIVQLKFVKGDLVDQSELKIGLDRHGMPGGCSVKRRNR